MAAPPGSVWYDVRPAQHKTNFERGIPRAVTALAEALLDTPPDVIAAFGLDPELPMPSSLQPLFGSGRLRWTDPGRVGPDPKPSIFHLTSPFESMPMDRFWPAWARNGDVRTVVTLHDLVPILFPEHYFVQPYERAVYTARMDLLRAADRLLSVSESSAADAVEHLGVDESRITVIDSGVMPSLASMVGSREEAVKVIRAGLPAVRDGFILYVGATDWRKNLEGLISAYGLLPKSFRRAHQLVIVCKLPAERLRQVQRHARRAKVGDDLLLTGFVPDRELAALYRTCDLFVFPSMYEGAGLPVLEAMSCDAPVAASNTASVPEILGDLRGTFDPTDPQEIAGCLRRTVDDGEELGALRERSRRRFKVFTWERVAEKAIEGYERALAVPKRRLTRSRKRIAVFTPWPPDGGEVARYSRRLVAELAAHADVDVIVCGELTERHERSLDPDVGLWGSTDFGWLQALRDYDRILYVLGNSELHIDAFDALMRWPGTVLAHDVRFTELYRAFHERKYPYASGWIERRLDRMYGDRVPEEHLERVPDGRTEIRFGVFMSQEVQAHAERMLVHSRYAADVLRMDCVPGTQTAPSDVIGYGVPAVSGRNGRGRPDSAAVVVPEVGDRLIPAELALHGFAELVAAGRSAEALFLGVDDAVREELALTASRLEIEERVRLCGDVDEEAYWRYLLAGDLAVRLQDESEGEASGAVSDCIAARLPTIVSQIGWAKELPSPVVLPVPHNCLPSAVAATMASVLDDAGLREGIRAAQDEYAERNSFAAVAERYVRVLEL